MQTNILVLAAGRPSTITDHEQGYPLCLAELDGISILEKILRNTEKIINSRYAFTLSETDIRRFHLDNIVNVLAPNSFIARVHDSAKGSAASALLAASQLNKDDSLLIISANELVDMELNTAVDNFKARHLDAGTLVFSSVHPRYSYVKLNSAGLVIQATQRNPISKNATAGIFWFNKTGDFVEAAKTMIKKSAAIDGKYYIAPTFNELVLKQQKIGVYEIDPRVYRPLKSESQRENYERGGAV